MNKTENSGSDVLGTEDRKKVEEIKIRLQRDLLTLNALTNLLREEPLISVLSAECLRLQENIENSKQARQNLEKQ